MRTAATIVQAAALLLLGAGTVAAQCSECSGKKAAVHPQFFFKKLDGYSLPPPASIQLRDHPEEPVVFHVIVALNGKPCSVDLVGELPPKLSQAVLAVGEAMLTWRFKPAFVVEDGHQVCLESKIFVYFRGAAGKTILLIPYLTDAGEKPN